MLDGKISVSFDVVAETADWLRHRAALLGGRLGEAIKRWKR
ncbi:hypothetical protein [Bradyrhizobium lablabi]|nr:hypothetical protein [Bradyrhizobium lablabi]